MSHRGIEREIYQSLTNERNYIAGYGLTKIREEMHEFMNYDENREREDPLVERKNLALEMAKRILDDHGKASTFADLLEFLKRIEIGAQFFDEKLRDHLIHSLSNYLLGLYLICKSDKLHWIFSEMRTIDPLVWKLAALLHDVGYPVETFSRQMNVLAQGIESFKRAHMPKKNPLTNRLSLFRKDTQSNVSMLSERYFRNLENLYRGDNVFKLIGDRLSSFGIDVRLRDYFYEKIRTGFVDHGIFSAIIMLNLIDALYAEHNPGNLQEKYEETKSLDGDTTYLDWGRRWFDKEIVDAASAISLHNLVTKPIMTDIQIDLEKTPALYLLVLSDNIQIWRRHSVFREVYSPDTVQIAFNPKEILCSFAIAEEEKSEAENVLENKLVDNELTIRVERSHQRASTY